MVLPAPEPGLVIRYAFLWSDEFRDGRDEAVKDRPAVVVLAVRRRNHDTVVLVAPITHRPPDPDAAVEIPARVKVRLGRDDERSWIVASELNEFVWPGPDLRTVPGTDRVSYGFLPPHLFDRLRRSIAALRDAGRLARVPRT